MFVASAAGRDLWRQIGLCGRSTLRPYISDTGLATMVAIVSVVAAVVATPIRWFETDVVPMERNRRLSRRLPLMCRLSVTDRLFMNAQGS